jgi:hypothetical protein
MCERGVLAIDRFLPRVLYVWGWEEKDCNDRSICGVAPHPSEFPVVCLHVGNDLTC